MEDSIFTKIIKGEIPSYKIYEDDNYFAFLDIKPINVGHTLVVPKQQVDYIFDLDEKTYLGLFEVAKKLAPVIQKATGAVRIGISIEGFEIPHAHVHVVPIFKQKELDPDNQHLATEDELKETQEKILSEL